MFALFLANATPSSLNYGDYTGDTWRALLGIGIFFLVVIGAYLLMRWFSSRAYGGTGRGNLRVLERTVIGKDAYLLLVQVGTRTLAVCVNKDNATLLCELSPEESSDIAAPAAGTQAGVPDGRSTFGQRFLHNMKLQAGLLPKGTPPATPGGDSGSKPDAAGTGDKTDADPTPEQTAASFAAVLQRVQEASLKPADSGRNTSKEEDKRLDEWIHSPNPTPADSPKAVAAEVSGQTGFSPRQAPPAVKPPEGPAEGYPANFKHYDDAINALHQLGQISDGHRIRPVASKAAAATYAAAIKPAAAVKNERQEDEAAEVLEALREQRRVREAEQKDDAGGNPAQPEPEPAPVGAEPEPSAPEPPVMPASFGPPEAIIPLKPVKPKTVPQPEPPVSEDAAFTDAASVTQSRAPQFTAVAADSLDDFLPFRPTDEKPAAEKPAGPPHEAIPEPVKPEPVKPEPVKQEKSVQTTRAERQNAMQKLSASRGAAAAQENDAQMDELFDKIQQRSSRYTRYGKKQS